MFSKEESAKLRKEFWTSFGKSFPKKWLLYNTKIKGFSFKFVADRKKAMVCLDIENPEELINLLYFDKMISLKSLLENELPRIIFNEDYELESGKKIHRIYVPFEGKFSVYNKNTWRDCFEFYMETMPKFETFFFEYEDFIKDI
ncbi:DUF4268 domain-containing protein [uncultured Polaribacter sp.]|uniref:DUF4268 domain-containing protein n=1 Tax=uncultured Polaribacter sp. TaxID=174711 RepID=UPI00262588E6|nr:DUF4268 domain-containing protein [uncultured Polaribacter sp.]